MILTTSHSLPRLKPVLSVSPEPLLAGTTKGTAFILDCSSLSFRQQSAAPALVANSSGPLSPGASDWQFRS